MAHAYIIPINSHCISHTNIQSIEVFLQGFTNEFISNWTHKKSNPKSSRYEHLYHKLFCVYRCNVIIWRGWRENIWAWRGPLCFSLFESKVIAQLICLTSLYFTDVYEPRQPQFGSPQTCMRITIGLLYLLGNRPISIVDTFYLQNTYNITIPLRLTSLLIRNSIANANFIEISLQRYIQSG